MADIIPFERFKEDNMNDLTDEQREDLHGWVAAAVVVAFLVLVLYLMHPFIMSAILVHKVQNFVWLDLIEWLGR